MITSAAAQNAVGALLGEVVVVLLPMSASVEVVTERVLAHAQPLAAEWRAPEKALGLRLAATVHAPRAHPPFAAAIKDGFAVRAADTPGSFAVVAECRAGASNDGMPTLGTCEAAYITTGAPLPPGTDAVVAIEDVELVDDALAAATAPVVVGAATADVGKNFHVARGLPPGHEVRSVGSDVSAGSKLLKKGTRLGAAELAILASVGCMRVQVVPAPRVAMYASFSRPMSTLILHPISLSLSLSLSIYIYIYIYIKIYMCKRECKPCFRIKPRYKNC